MTARSDGPLSIRANGVLVLAAVDLPQWAHFGTVLARVETNGDEPVTDGTRRVVRRARPADLVEGWTDEAIRRWAYECVDRAVRLHAVTALEAAGIIGHADRLRALSSITDGATARAASEAASEAASPMGRST